MLHDDTTTVSQLKEAIYALCLEKGWGVDGVQNPQQVAMAMTVEMSELLELFQWLNPPDVEKLLNGEDPAYVARIAEEFADVMMYGMQLMRAEDRRFRRNRAQDRGRARPSGEPQKPASVPVIYA